MSSRLAVHALDIKSGLDQVTDGKLHVPGVLPSSLLQFFESGFCREKHKLICRAMPPPAGELEAKHKLMEEASVVVSRIRYSHLSRVAVSFS